MKSVRVIHPFLFPLYPVLVLISINFWQVSFWEGVRLAIIVIIFTLLLLLLLQAIYKNWHRSGFIASTILISITFINYSIYIPENLKLFSFHITRTWLVYLIWFIIIFIANSIIHSKRIRPDKITQYLNISAFLLLLISGYFLWGYVRDYFKDPLRGLVPIDETSIFSLNFNTDYRPDIFYIIVDGYARNDVLKELFNFDNTEFINYLKGQGFYVAEKSQSNYIQTALSLSSSLNYEYLDSLATEENGSGNREPLRKLIMHSRVRSILEEAGYDVITLSSGYSITEIKDSDLYLPSSPTFFSEIEILFFNATGFQIILDSIKIEIDQTKYTNHRKSINYEFEQLGKIPELHLNTPKFVFAHILLPHPPFVFNQNGDPNTINRPFTTGDGSHFEGTYHEYINDYNEQLVYTNHMLKKTISSVLQNSETPPIIILQADHGPGAYLDWKSAENSCLKERFSILNAYYIPHEAIHNLYPTITPVNTFRVILNSLFNTKLRILPDINYYSTWQNLYNFEDVSSKSQLPCKNLDDYQ